MASSGAPVTFRGFSKRLECSICKKKGKHREATTFCQECEGYLCSDCTDTHVQFPALRNHKTTPIEEIRKSCGVCKTKGIEKDARCFCKDCDAWICDDCKESHENFRDLQKNTIVTKDALIHSDSTAPSDISTRLEQLSTKPSEDSSVYSDNETKPFEESSLLHDSETKPQAYGEDKNGNLQTKPSDYDASKSPAKAITESPAAEDGNIDILRYKTIKKIKELNVKVSSDTSRCNITGCCFIPGGKLILCDWGNDKIKLLDRSLSVVDSLDLPGNPRDVALVDSSNVIVTMPVRTQLQFIQVSPSLKPGRTIHVGEWCSGVDVAVGRIFISYNDFIDKVGDIRVHDLEGRVLGTKLGISPNGSNMFRRPDFVAVNRSGDKIFVSDYDTNTVSCLTSDGKIVYQYRDKELRGSAGLLVDDNDNAIVCSWWSNIVQVIQSAGNKHKTLLTSEDGIDRPQCVRFRPGDGTLVVGGEGNYLLVYNMS